MDVSFVHFEHQASRSTTRDLGTWELRAVPRIGEQVILDRPGDPAADLIAWDVISVMHDVASQTVVCSVTRSDVAAHQLRLAWRDDLAAPPYALPQWLECAVIPRVGDTITLITLNHDQLAQLEQVRDLDADDLDNETVESRLGVMEVRHAADRFSAEVANVGSITLIVAPV